MLGCYIFKPTTFISLCSFYYVNWDDPIYDQFDDYMEKLEQEEEKAKHDQRSKGTVRLDYKVGKHFGVFIFLRSKVPRRPSKQPPHGPQVEDIATKYEFLQNNLTSYIVFLYSKRIRATKVKLFMMWKL